MLSLFHGVGLPRNGQYRKGKVLACERQFVPICFRADKRVRQYISLRAQVMYAKFRVVRP